MFARRARSHIRVIYGGMPESRAESDSQAYRRLDCGSRQLPGLQKADAETKPRIELVSYETRNEEVVIGEDGEVRG